ncbi:hypothetical protein QS257_10320 [Terrilactibacillus sp. S3-3]|nr:hypothetical protein QS257_10320 [Terrilactibacillus sp. S3-3]
MGMVVKEKNGSGTWQTKPYYFWTNQQRGDVTAIVDSSGAKVGAYTYDALAMNRAKPATSQRATRSAMPAITTIRKRSTII